MVGTGSAKRDRSGYLVFFMRVEKIISFNDFWNDLTLQRKKPDMRGSFLQRYGDNIYWKDEKTQKWYQSDSFHSKPDGVLNEINLHSDVGHTENVLLSKDYAYWGGAGPKVPKSLAYFVHDRQGHLNYFKPEEIRKFEEWVRSLGQQGFVSDPTEWRYS